MNPRCRRYSPKVILFAQSLADAGRSVAEIQAACGRFGPVPSRNTVRCWIDPDYAHLHRLRNRRQMSKGTIRGVESPADLLSRRLRDLRSIGISYRSIAAIFQLDYGVDLDEERLRYAMNRNAGQVRLRDGDLVAAERRLKA